MKYILTLALCLFAANAQAGDALLCMSDSKGLEGSTNTPPDDWCALVAASQGFGNRWCRSAVAGRTAVGGLVFIAAAYNFCQTSGHTITDVVIDYTANDAKTVPQPTAASTATTLRAIAAYVEGRGAKAHIVTPPPILNTTLWPAGSNDYAADVAANLWAMNLTGTAYTEAPLRDITSEAQWLACAPDGVHPSGLACRQRYDDAIGATW